MADRFRLGTFGHRALMDTSTLSKVYQSDGPFATVLVDVGHESENGAHEHELRVRAAREALREQGAPEGVVTAVGDRLGELVPQPVPVARLVVVTADGVQHDETAAFQVDDPVATWGPLPDLARWIEHADGAVTFVLAVVDHEGGDVAVHRSDLPSPEQTASVHGSTENIHQVGADDWGSLKYQHRTENVWAHNAAEVADRITSHVRAGNRLVLLAGDPRSRSLVRERLDGTHAEVVDLESGSRADDGGEEALQAAVRGALLEQVVRRRVGRVHELRERLGRGEGAVAGLDDVTGACVRGQVATLLLDPAAAAQQELAPGTYRGLSIGTQETVPADVGLVAAAALTSADVAIVSSATLGGEPVAALLRWDQPA